MTHSARLFIFVFLLVPVLAYTAPTKKAAAPVSHSVLTVPAEKKNQAIGFLPR